MTLSAVGLLVVLGSACDKVVSVSGTILVPLEVQQLFSAEQPGKIDLTTTKLGKGTALPYLCAPTNLPLSLRYQFTVIGCREEQELQARAFHVMPDAEEVHCGDRATNSPAGTIGEEVASGATLIFRGLAANPCESGTATGDVTLTLVN